MKLLLKGNNFVCIFPRLVNLHAIKCTGQICENVSKHYKKNSYILTYRNGDYSNFDKYCPNVKLIFLKGKYSDPGWRKIYRFILLIILNARRINILYYYHSPGHGILFELLGIIYKTINRRGKLHIRFEYELNELPDSYPISSGKNGGLSFRYLIKKKFFKSIDILGVLDDQQFSLSRNKGFWNILKSENVIKQQLNGYIDLSEEGEANLTEKRNIICLAGRFDSKNKGLDVFLDSIRGVYFKDWEIIILGDLGEEQQRRIIEVSSANSSLQGKIKVPGHIYDINDYWNYISSSRIFCLPSLHDGIPLVLPDAMARGNIIVCSDLYGIKDIVAKDIDVGFFFKKGDSGELSRIWEQIFSNPSVLEEKAKRSIYRAKELLRWSTIVQKLDL